jgi:hypothetical protein
MELTNTGSLSLTGAGNDWGSVGCRRITCRHPHQFGSVGSDEITADRAARVDVDLR